jgi:hypothetical protein
MLWQVHAGYVFERKTMLVKVSASDAEKSVVQACCSGPVHLFSGGRAFFVLCDPGAVRHVRAMPQVSLAITEIG